MEAFLKALTVGGAACAALLGSVFVLQGYLLYFPEMGRQILRTPKDVGLDYEEVWLTTEDGVRIESWYIPVPAARGAALLAHGNAGNISHRLDYAPMFHRLGYSLLLLEYRGYGRSEGKPSEEGTYADARAAWRHLVEERGIPPERIVLVGESLGGAVVARLAVAERPGALVLASSFISVPELAAELYPWLPARWLARYRYDTREALGRVSSPVLIAHSRQDDIVPFRHGETLFAAVKGPKAFVEMTGGHNDGFLFMRETWRAELGSFLAQHLPAGAMKTPPNALHNSS
ncbi:alpha/beta hydrolase [Pseudogulbenkiania sp. MAI-1]|uniref:alpha/beta hydrolase n=1 Tax=Pseudogulbenkiania sp. MAI-1 TaxID=990370 RepID=UPI00045EA883|nr:alpha/beta hydrolase [Pseudogulbenkiania sp. MAI-1]